MSKKHIPESQKKRIEEISLFIKNWRINDNMTQNDFSKLAEVHPNSIYNIEHQKVYNIVTLLKIIDATGLTVAEFFEGME
jgi:DNA-binding XRE family transcriptional regulator